VDIFNKEKKFEKNEKKQFKLIKLINLHKVTNYLKHLKNRKYLLIISGKSLSMNDTNFKVKSKKKKTVASKQRTLDSIHNEKIQYFEDLQKSISDKKKKITDLSKTLKILDQKKLADLSDSELQQKLDIQDSIKDLERDIRKISKRTDEKNYLLNTGNLIYQYYENMDRIAQGDNFQAEQNNNPGNILTFFKPGANISSQKIKTDTDKRVPGFKELEDEEFSTINQEFTTREKLLDQYLYHVDPHHVPKVDNNPNKDICPRCREEREFSQTEALLICHSCGETEQVLLDSEKPSYKDPPREISYFAYKRINHFNEWLAQFQAKESTEIPDLVYNQILMELKKERIENMATLQPPKLREILKRLKLNKYYEHVPHIINRLNGVPAPIMTRNTEEKLRTMFKEIQTPFMKHCPKDRKNFLSYSYVLHKFVELLELDEFLPCFPLLKSREKLLQQDRIWNLICKELKWEFIKSI